MTLFVYFQARAFYHLNANFELNESQLGDEKCSVLLWARTNVYTFFNFSHFFVDPALSIDFLKHFSFVFTFSSRFSHSLHLFAFFSIEK